MIRRLFLTQQKISDFISLFPTRVKRLWQACLDFFKAPNFFKIGLIWFSILDVFGLGDLFESIQNVLKPIRPLNKKEIATAKIIFGESLSYERINLDERAYLGPKQKKFAYVFCNTINSYGRLSSDLFIHEMMHVWQYKNLGLSYIPNAWYAQQSKEGYNYGGLEAVKKAIVRSEGLFSFNYEQQAEIVTDYFRLLQGRPPFWGDACPEDISYYSVLVDVLKHPALLK